MPMQGNALTCVIQETFETNVAIRLGLIAINWVSSVTPSPGGSLSKFIYTCI